MDEREFEHDLMPLALDQGGVTVVWSPLGCGRMSGKHRRSHPIDATSHPVQNGDSAPPVPNERLFAVMEDLDALAAETGHSVPQIALNLVLVRPSVATVIIGVRNEAELIDNLGAVGWVLWAGDCGPGAVGWNLSAGQIGRLDGASRIPLPCPNWHQAGFRSRNPAPVSE